jgi:hypothetical protein
MGILMIFPLHFRRTLFLKVSNLLLKHSLLLFLLTPMAFLLSKQSNATKYHLFSARSDANKDISQSYPLANLEKFNNVKQITDDPFYLNRINELYFKFAMNASVLNNNSVIYGAFKPDDKLKKFGSEVLTVFTPYSWNILKFKFQKNINQLFIHDVGAKTISHANYNNIYFCSTNSLTSILKSKFNGAIASTDAKRKEKTTITFIKKITLSCHFEVAQGFNLLHYKTEFLDLKGEWVINNFTNEVYLSTPNSDNLTCCILGDLKVENGITNLIKVYHFDSEYRFKIE